MIYHEFCFGWVNGSPASEQRAAGGLWVPKQCCGSSARCFGGARKHGANPKAELKVVCSALYQQELLTGLEANQKD